MNSKSWLAAWAVFLTLNIGVKAFAPSHCHTALYPSDTGTITLTTHDPSQWGCDIWCGGTITGLGGLPLTESGVCWSLDTLPTINDNHKNCTGSISFDCLISDWELGFWNCWQPLYFRAYATNSKATFYGQVKSYLYQPQFIIVFNEISNLTPTSVTFRRNLVFPGIPLPPDKIMIFSTLFPPGYSVCSNWWWEADCTADSLQPATDYTIREEVFSTCPVACNIVSVNDFTFRTPPITVGIKNTDQAVCKIYPNPAYDWLNIEVTSISEQKLELEVLDILGRVQISKSLGEANPGRNEFRLHIANIPPGLYLIRLVLRTENGSKSFLQKVVIE